MTLIANRRSWLRQSASISLAVLLHAILFDHRAAFAQKQLADELIVIGAGQRAQEGQRNDVRANPTPGAQ